MLEARGKLLIVDEDDSIRTTLSPLFSQLGYHVRSCGDGFSALAEIRKEIPDVMLADLSMAVSRSLNSLWWSGAGFHLSGCSPWAGHFQAIACRLELRPMLSTRKVQARRA